jgi:DNA-3-methyladenine glycosylase
MREDRSFAELLSSTDTAVIARSLLGAVLVRTLADGTRLSGRIIETEAYLGVQDRASHSYNARRTPRNEHMYAEPGTAYVYFTYGMHHCMNVVTGPVDYPSAVLVRSLEPMEGLETMRMLRRRTSKTVLHDRDLCSGPGKLCAAMDIDRGLSGLDLLKPGPLVLAPAVLLPGERVRVGPRIGIGSAGPWVRRLLRFWIDGSPFVGVQRGAGRRLPSGR